MNKTTYYINGNAVRELDEAAPVRRPQKSTRELEEIRRKKKNYSARSGKRNPRTREAMKALKWRSSESSINTLPPVRRRKREAGNPRPPSLPTRRSYCGMPYAPSSERH